jgi:hypothetical protein
MRISNNIWAQKRERDETRRRREGEEREGQEG